MVANIAFAQKCQSTVDPSWNTNPNKKGTACHAQVAKVRQLEFHPNFECDKSIRERWEREMAVAMKMKCAT